MQKLLREEMVTIVAQGVTRLVPEKFARIKCCTKLNKLKVALI